MGSIRGWFSRTVSAALLFSLGLAGCAGGPGSDALERSLQADPLLLETGAEPEPTDPAPEPEAAAVAPDVGLGLGQQIGETEQPISPDSYTDLGDAPEELQPYLEDLVAWGLLVLMPDEVESRPTEAARSGGARFSPNQAVSRREYARWLMAVNNRLYRDTADRRIRQSLAGGDAAFEDVSPDDPDFGAIQGLADAGLIPSPLTGNDGIENFRPEAPLTRADLLQWKVPLDTREGLPNATAEEVEQAWGFRDVDQLAPDLLRAVLADHEAGEFANLRRAFGFTTLLQPDKPVTRAEAAASLWRFGGESDGRSIADLASSEADPSNHPLIDQLRGDAEP